MTMRFISATTPPTDFRHLNDRIAKRSITFPKQLEQVAKVVLAHPEIAAFESSNSLASRCGVSVTTAVRLARHLGFKDFREMKMLLRKHVKERAGRCSCQ